MCPGDTNRGRRKTRRLEEFDMEELLQQAKNCREMIFGRAEMQDELQY